MPDANETVIRLDHDAKIAEIWTANRRIISTLKRIGADPMERQIQGQWWRVAFRVGRRGLILGKTRTGGLRGASKAIAAPTVNDAVRQ